MEGLTRGKEERSSPPADVASRVLGCCRAMDDVPLRGLEDVGRMIILPWGSF